MHFMMTRGPAALQTALGRLRTSENTFPRTPVNKTRRAGTCPGMDPGPSRYVALRRRRAARLRVLVIVGGEPDPTFFSRSTGSELWCSAPGPSISRRALRLACGGGHGGGDAARQGP